MCMHTIIYSCACTCICMHRITYMRPQKDMITAQKQTHRGSKFRPAAIDIDARILNTHAHTDIYTHMRTQTYTDTDTLYIFAEILHASESNADTEENTHNLHIFTKNIHTHTRTCTRRIHTCTHTRPDTPYHHRHLHTNHSYTTHARTLIRKCTHTHPDTCTHTRPDTPCHHRHRRGNPAWCSPYRHLSM